jgi:glutamate N-acetyltransferase/amino-acid N-acetyltransferase
MGHVVPNGFQLAGVHCGLKSNPAKLDLTLIVSDQPSVAAGVYTQNRVCAAPVTFDRERTPTDQMRVIVANSGNANACTGQRGFEDACEMARLASEAVSAQPDQALVLSTGIIGEFLPMQKITQGIQAAAANLGNDESALIAAARGIMTTDRGPKLASRVLELDGHTVQIAGLAKGAGMIGPNMATMLAIILTDAPLNRDLAQELLQDAADESFNCISVEGHTSTNDTMLLLASGEASIPSLSGDQQKVFRQALVDLCIELAKMIPDDGEGASHLITIDVQGCESREAARQIAETVANSALVKTAVAGADPNWGRIVSAVGYAGVPFEPGEIDLWVNGYQLYRQGAPAPFDAAEVSRSMATERETRIVIKLTQGSDGIRFWTSDLTMDYVRLNSDYHT